ncbi:DMT family transporter [Rhizobium pusense]|uniref:DMT family transporter n=1 Tax=Agrobacterium pusense TaxID=648995 RepID=UPI001C6ED70D|nr:DMT family transporter [Agrobacterium pusense]MBW9076611.1 DMT family transporter [Agrobacterium pusense]
MSLDRLAPAIFVFLWSTGWVTAKYAVYYTGPLTFLCLRYLLAGVLLWAICRFSSIQWPESRVDIFRAILSGVFLHGLYLGMIWWAIGQGVPAAIGGIIAGLQPLMTAVAARFMIGERISPLQRAGLLIGFAGIAIAVLPKVMAAGAGGLSVPLYAVAVNVLGMTSVTYGTLYQKKYVHGGNIMAVATLQYVGALLVTVPFALLLEDGHVDWSLGLAATLAWSVGAISIGAVALLLYLIRRGQVSRAASLIYLVSPLAAVEAALLFGETLTPAMIAGTVLAVTGVYLANRKPAASVAAG